MYACLNIKRAYNRPLDKLINLGLQSDAYIIHPLDKGGAMAEVEAVSKLRRWRLKERLTLEDIAGLSGYSAVMISLVETGHRRLNREAKIKLARRMGVSVKTLFEVEDVTERKLVAR